MYLEDVGDGLSNHILTGHSFAKFYGCVGKLKPLNLRELNWDLQYSRINYYMLMMDINMYTWYESYIFLCTLVTLDSCEFCVCNHIWIYVNHKHLSRSKTRGIMHVFFCVNLIQVGIQEDRFGVILPKRYQ